MAYLTGRNRTVAGRPPAAAITAAGKHVVVLGGGDTSSDCLGCALREGAASVTEIAHGPTPPVRRTPLATWPEWPFLLRTYPAHEEGGRREWELEPTALAGANGGVRTMHGRRITGAEVAFEADLVLIAIGFAGVEDDAVYAQLGVDVAGGTVAARSGGETGVPDVFAAGDCVRGADLIVTAIASGRAAAAGVHAQLTRAAAAPAA
jgi:glutamate synthase (NADPH/NADH) small chain